MDRVGIGIIGLGLAVKPHALALSELSDRVRVVGGFSPSPGRREAFHRAYRLPVVASLDALLADPGVAALLLLTPPRTHAELVRRVARAGKHVLVEKPLGVDFVEARELAGVVEAAGVRGGVVFQHRFRQGATALRALLRKGALGAILSASASIRWWRPAAYFAQAGRGTRARDAGGVLLTQAIHSLDLLLDLVGPAACASAFCRTSPLRAIDTEDIACAAIRYANGAIGVVDATTVAYPGHSERIEIAGTGGSAVLEAERLRVERPDQPPLIVDGASQGGGGADPMAFSHEPHRRLLEDFVTALVEHRAPQCDLRSALPVQALIDAILASSALGRPTDVAA